MTATDKKVKGYLTDHPDAGRGEIAKALRMSPNTVRDVLQRLRQASKSVEVKISPPDVDDYILTALSKHSLTHKDLADGLGISVNEINAGIERLRAQPRTINQVGTHLTLSKPGFARVPLNIIDGGNWIRVGLVSDTHLASREARLDCLHAQYDLFQREGITTVLHAGNLIDGHIPGLNTESVLTASMDGQTQYAVENYPSRKNITTHYISGDDHESWFMKNGFNWGAYLQMMAEKSGRTDLKYLAHVEADIEFTTPSGKSTILKLQHPGGGSAYARSYKAQKQVEAFQGGEKPAILVQGHYHVAGYVFDRNVHVIGMPGFQDQTVFARKKQLRMEIGGVVLEFKQNPEDGAVTRFRPEFNMFFDRGYYKRFLGSDAILSKGRLQIKTK